MWRITDDFWDNWELLHHMFERCELWQNQVSKGCYPDCDMLPLGYIGNGFGQERMTNFTKEEQMTMMTLWCMFRSPLMLGAEMTKMDDWTLSLLTNEKVLALLGETYRGTQIMRNRSQAVWISKDSESGNCYVGLFNFLEEEAEVEIAFEELEWNNKCRVMEEVWTGEDVRTEGFRIKERVAPHGAKLFLVK
jgi:hypothetical protein